MSLTDTINTLDQRLKTVEARFKEMGYSMKRLVQSAIKKRFKVDLQSETQYGMHTALCIDTIDPWKQNRIRFFSPLYHDPKTPIKSLPWAHAISNMGGFDDSGMNWVPPAGSTVCILYENGSRSSPYYMGTTWHRTRGPEGQRNFGYTIEEFDKIHEGHRDGYLLGPDDGSQVFPPWNTENYNGPDIDSILDFFLDAAIRRNTTYAHIYGFKTPQKHMLKMVDGDYKCNHRWKRIELMSSCGGVMVIKDDHLHPSGEHTSPKCISGSSGDADEVTSGDQNQSDLVGDLPPTCDQKSTCIGAPVGDPKRFKGPAASIPVTPGKNQFFKSRSECRPYKGVGTPMNGRIDLPQKGIQILSHDGATICFDASVEEPTGIPNHEQGREPFDMGCQNTMKNMTWWQSATGQRICLSDIEDTPENRGTDNGITIRSATGNKITLSDHTVGNQVAGDERGIKLESTSTHSIELHDEGCEVTAKRMDNGEPSPTAKNGFIRIRSGYGLMMTFADSFSQESTEQQYIEIFAPQKDNKVHGPHLMVFQEAPSGPGQVFLRAGGDYIVATTDNLIEMVGDPTDPDQPNNRVSKVNGHTVFDTKLMHFHKAKTHILKADEAIVLAVAEDCPVDGNPNPCLYPVIVGRCPTPCPLFPWMIHWTEKAMSEYVYASAKKIDCD